MLILMLVILLLLLLLLGMPWAYMLLPFSLFLLPMLLWPLPILMLDLLINKQLLNQLDQKKRLAFTLSLSGLPAF